MNNHPKVLVVDDLEDWQLTIKGMLKKLGCDVELAGSLVEAREVLNKGKIDLAVLDMRLDERDENNTEGLNLAEEIQTNWPTTKVIIATGYSNPEALQRALPGCFSRHLTRPGSRPGWWRMSMTSSGGS